MLVIALLYVVTFLDQWTKWWVQGQLDYGQRLVLIPGFLDFRHVRNTGAAWGLFADYQPVLIAVSMFVLAVLGFRGGRIFGTGRRGRVTLGLLLAGICGNLIDRLRLGYVLDFIGFHWRGWHFPSFNVADMAITIGVGLYLLSTLAHQDALKSGVTESGPQSPPPPSTPALS